MVKESEENDKQSELRGLGGKKFINFPHHA